MLLNADVSDLAEDPETELNKGTITYYCVSLKLCMEVFFVFKNYKIVKNVKEPKYIHTYVCTCVYMFIYTCTCIHTCDVAFSRTFTLHAPLSWF